jgi:hypothetical protein
MSRRLLIPPEGLPAKDYAVGMLRERFGHARADGCIDSSVTIGQRPDCCGKTKSVTSG